MDRIEEPNDKYHVLVTGANAGVGLAICRRLIDEFLYTHPKDQSLVLIFTTRSKSKADETLQRLHAHVRKIARRQRTASPDIIPHTDRIHLHYAQIDLLSLRSVQTAARQLVQRFPKIDAVILNAGTGGGMRVDWPKAIWQVLTNFIVAVTWPNYKIAEVGSLTEPQLTSRRTANGGGPDDHAKSQEPALGQVFCANVFGHYLLIRWIMPLLARVSDEPGRIIWVSSLEAYASAFSVSDLQCVRSNCAYEGTKRLTDILALTSALPSTSPWTDSYFAPLPEPRAQRPRMYVSHPGICSTAILPLPSFLSYVSIAAFYLARLLGSIWHNISTYTGACAAVWLALSPIETLESMEARGGEAKWGSACDTVGGERVERTEVEGWGFGGVIGDATSSGLGRRRGRRAGMKDLTMEERQEFEVLGRDVWREMEELREVWETLLAGNVGEPVDGIGTT